MSKKTKSQDAPLQKQESVFEVREIGVVKSIQKIIVIATGLPSCASGQIVEFIKGEKGLVIGFNEDEVQILVLGPAANIRAGDEVYNKGQFLSLPVGEGFRGRVVDSLCQPQDQDEAIETSQEYPVFKVAPGVMARIPVDKTLETGT